VRGHGERRGHAFLRRHEFHAGLQPVAQRLDWRRLCLELFGQFYKVLHHMPVDRLVRCLPGREVPIQHPDPDAGMPGHGLQARLRSALAEYRLCRCPDAGEYRGDCPDGRKLDDGRVLCRTPADPRAQS
jgi:hypothetical protein